MSRAPRIFLVCYDISDQRRLQRVYKVMRGFGDHLQYSVFRCTLSEMQLALLSDRLAQEIHHAEDQVLFVPLGSVDAERPVRMTTMGRPMTHPERVVRIL